MRIFYAWPTLDKSFSSNPIRDGILYEIKDEAYHLSSDNFNL